jgi:hypothetical protein
MRKPTRDCRVRNITQHDATVLGLTANAFVATATTQLYTVLLDVTDNIPRVLCGNLGNLSQHSWALFGLDGHSPPARGR